MALESDAVRTLTSPGRRRHSVDPAVTTTRDRQTSVRSRCPSTSLDRPWPSATPYDDDEPNEDVRGLVEGPEVVDQPATTWDGFDQHIRCIATTDAREQYVKKRSTDKASDTYKAAMREIYGSIERLDVSADSDEELADSAFGDSSRDELGLARQMSVEASRKVYRKTKESTSREQPDSETRTTSAAGWRTESTSSAKRNTHQRSHQQQQQQQQQLDENALKRLALYEKYLERQNAWAEGLTKSGKDILLAIQRSKKRLSRFPSSPSTDEFRRPKMVRSTTWSSNNSTARSGFQTFTSAAESSQMSCNG